MTTLWQEIKALPACEPMAMPEPYPGVLLFRQLVDNTHWLVGQYGDLRRIETDLRWSPPLRSMLTSRRVRIGLRADDVPPAELERQERYGSTIPGQDRQTDFAPVRAKSLAPPVHVDRPVSGNRRGDREQNVKDYWRTQTPQAHHIVEFNNLETLGASQKVGSSEMDYQQLPAVLLAAEFHQRYISSILKPAQEWERKQLLAEIVSVYRGIYQGRGQLFEPLWSISNVILKQAGIS